MYSYASGPVVLLVRTFVLNIPWNTAAAAAVRVLASGLLSSYFQEGQEEEAGAGKGRGVKEMRRVEAFRNSKMDVTSDNHCTPPHGVGTLRA